MTETAASARSIVRQARREVASAARGDDEARLAVTLAPVGAKVMLLPGRFRDAAYVRRHVEFVLTRPAEQGEQHVRRNLGAIRMTLEEMGVDEKAIQTELRTIEARIRAEIWKQVILSDGDA